MDCLGSRPLNDEKASSDSLRMLLDQLGEGQFIETIIISTSVYNCCYFKQRKEWILQKRRITKSVNKWVKSNLESRNYIHSFLDSHPTSSKFQALHHLNHTHTALLKTDFFPQQIFMKFAEVKQAQLINFSNNGKYTFSCNCNCTSYKV